MKLFQTSKRIITFVLSATLILGEATVSLAAPIANNDSASEIEMTEYSMATGAFIPGKVTNVGFKDDVVPGVKNPHRLSWSAVQGADGYELRYIDSAGKEYVDGLDEYISENKYKSIIYPSTSWLSYDLSAGFNLYQIENKNGVYSYVTNAKNKLVHLKHGASYKVQVRAYYYGDEKTYGPWSDAVSYNPPKFTVDKVSDLRVIEDGYGVIQLKMSTSGYAEVEVKDSNGNYYYNYVNDEYDSNGKVIGTEYDYRTLSPNTGDYGFMCTYYLYPEDYIYIYEKVGSNTYYTQKTDADGRTIRPFEAGKTYTFRARGFEYDDDGEKQVSAWSAPVTVKIPQTPKPAKTGNLRYSIEENSVYWNYNNAIYGYQYELKDSEGKIYTHGSDFTGNNYIDLDGCYQCTIDANGRVTAVKGADGKKIYAGQPGKKYTLRVRTYIDSNVYDKVNKEYIELYSDWSETLNISVPEVQVVDPTKVKVTGLTFGSGDNSLKWNKPEDISGLNNIRYEVEIKDNLNRTYSVVKTENGVQTLKNAVTANTQLSGDDVYSYVKIDDIYETVIDQDGKSLNAFKEGLQYTARVRMIAKTENSSVDKVGIWSDAYKFTVFPSVTSEGINKKPAKVTGVWVEDKPADNKELFYQYIDWNSIDNVYKYEIEVKDAAGNLFTEYANIVDGKLCPSYYGVYDYTKNYVRLEKLAELKSFKKVEGSALSILRDSNGNIIYPFINGQTYTFRVRAVNQYHKKNSDGTWGPYEYFIGDWSDPVKHTVTNSDLKVKDLKLVKYDEEFFYFDFKADRKFSDLYYQIATDSSFAEGSIVQQWDDINEYGVENTDYKFVINRYSLDESKTYYIRVVNSKTGNPNDILNNYGKSAYNSVLATAASTSIKTPAYKIFKAKDVTGLKIYNESADKYYFRFDAKLDYENGDEFVVEKNNVNDANNGNWAQIGVYTSSQDDKYDFSVLKSTLLDGANYIRVRAYTYNYDKKTGKVKKVYGKPSNVVALNKNDKTTSAIGTVSLVEETDSTYVFTYSGNPRLDEKIEIIYSTSSTFNDNDVEGLYTSEKSAENNKNKKYVIGKASLRPGRTYYLKMRVVNDKATTTEGKTSAYSNVVKFTTAIPAVDVSNSTVTKNSITIRMGSDSYNGWLSGYEIQKKSSKKWKTKTKSSASTFTDKKLKAFKVYSYRIRPYFYDKDTKKTTFGEWVYYEAMTGWSGNLKLSAKAASKTSVKLSWNKVKGAKGYEIYRLVASSASSKVSKGEGNGYSSYKLIKTVGSGKKSYTDKKLTKDMSYVYIVKAYKKVGKKKVYIQDSASVNLDFFLTKINSYQTANGKVKINWNPVMSSKGYKIEKQDKVTKQWKPFKTIKKAKTSSYTFPAAKDSENGDSYRIYAYNGKRITNYINVDVNPVLGVPSNVKAKVSGKKITISWKKVSGANYYRVFRSLEPSFEYDADKKAYYYKSWVEVGRYTPDSSAVKGYRYRTLEEMDVTSVTDEELTYIKNGMTQTMYAGPVSGTKYYYFVVAYKNKPQHGYIEENDEAAYYESAPSKAASATIKEVKPSKPVLAKVSSKKKTVSVTIKGSVKADGYEIYRSTKKKSGFKSIGEAKGISPVYKDKYNKKKNKLKKNKTYYYKVRSYVYNEDGSKVYSAYSTVKKVKFK